MIRKEQCKYKGNNNRTTMNYRSIIIPFMPSFNQIAIVTPWKLGLLRLKWCEYQPFYVNINELIDEIKI